eukprot:m.55338 g.55338  ORF g.55338 m.55338 type:complete len:391 (+) comp7596_c0_seq1:230-1402(+)
MAAPRIPSVDTSIVPESEPMADEPWEMTDKPGEAFDRLATSLTRILAGCKKRCTAERVKGSKQACVDLISFATRRFPGGLIPLDRLSDACHIFLRHRERPSGSAESDHATEDTDFAPGFSSRGRDDAPAAADPTDTTYDEYMFNAGAILFTQFYRERNREIRLAFVCGYRDALARAIAWSTANRSRDNTVRADSFVGMLAWLVSRAPRGNDGRPVAASRPIGSPFRTSRSPRVSSSRGMGASSASASGGGSGSPGVRASAASSAPVSLSWSDSYGGGSSAVPTSLWGGSGLGSSGLASSVSLDGSCLGSGGVGAAACAAAAYAVPAAAGGHCDDAGYSSGCKRRDPGFEDDLDTEMVGLSVEPGSPMDRADAARMAKRGRFGCSGDGPAA